MGGRRPHLRSALAAALLLAACAKVDSDPHEWVYDGPVNTCSGADDCSIGICDTDLGACTVPPVGQPLLARVVPDPATGTSAQVYAVDGSAGTLGAPLQVRVPVTVTGSTLVVVDDDETTEIEAFPLKGRVVFSDVGNRLPGHPAQITVYEADGSVFDLSLLPSAYDIIVIPDDEAMELDEKSHPMYYLDNKTLDTTGVFRDDAGDPVSLVVPESAAFVTGQVTLAGVPTNDLEVVAFDMETGRILSTVDTTDLDDLDPGPDTVYVPGHFSIGLAQSVIDPPRPFWLRVWRESEPQHPVFEAGGDEGFPPPSAGATLALESDALAFDAALGTPVRFQATVLQPVRTQDGTEMYDTAPSCFVSFSSADVAGGTVEKWVLTNESGELEETPGIPGVYLYKGYYTITVIPAYAPVGSTSDFSVFTTDEPQAIFADNFAGTVLLHLGWRPVVTGSVAAAGLAVPTSAVFAEPAVGAPETARSNSAMSSGSGSFHFWLDEGPYVVVAEAPAESYYAWDVVEADVPEEALALSFELPLPYTLRGTVAASAEQVNPIDVSGSVIEWYREIDGRAYAVGRSIADESGAFTALLPQ